MKKLKSSTALGRFFSDKKGYAAATFAIAGLPLLTLIGLTYDASMAYRYKTDLQVAADAATLSMARRSLLNPDISEEELVEAGKAIFEEHLGRQDVPTPVIYGGFNVDTGFVDAVLIADVEYEPAFGNLVGLESFNIKVESRAEFERNKLDFYMVLDNTPSMALAADYDAIATMEADSDFDNNNKSCAFACHTVNHPKTVESLVKKHIARSDWNPDLYDDDFDATEVDDDYMWSDEYDLNNNGKWDNWESNRFYSDFNIPTTSKKDTLFLAREKGIPLRIDAVKRGVKALADRIDEVKMFDGQHRVGLFDFGYAAWDFEPTQLIEQTANMDDVKDVADDMELMIFAGSDYANTELTTTMGFVEETIDDVMDDPANNDRRPVMFLVTDGVTDGRDTEGVCNGVWARWDNSNPKRCHEPIRPEVCDAIKDKGYRIAVLYTPYLKVEGNGWYDTHVKPWEDVIGPKLEECATSGLYFEADLNSDSIEEAMVTLLDRAIRALRLTGVRSDEETS